MVMTSAPAAKISAALSPWTMAGSASSCFRRTGSRRRTARRAVFPTTSPTNRMRTARPPCISRRRCGHRRPAPAPPQRRSPRLPGVVHGPRLPDHHDLDLARILHLVLNAAGDVPGQRVGLVVADAVRLDDDPHLAPGVDGIGLLDPVE